MQLYFNIGGEAVLRSVNIKALNKAFRMYHAIRKEVPGMKGARWAPFDITDALVSCFGAEKWGRNAGGVRQLQVYVLHLC